MYGVCVCVCEELAIGQEKGIYRAHPKAPGGLAPSRTPLFWEEKTTDQQGSVWDEGRCPGRNCGPRHLTSGPWDAQQPPPAPLVLQVSGLALTLSPRRPRVSPSSKKCNFRHSWEARGLGKRAEKNRPQHLRVFEGMEKGDSPRPSLPRPRFLLVRPSPSPQNLVRSSCARRQAGGGGGGSLTWIPGPLWVGWGWDWRAPRTARWAGDHIVPVPEPGGARDTNEAGWAHPGWGAPGGLSRVAVCRPSLSIPP